jgi:hypothetical protein
MIFLIVRLVLMGSLGCDRSGLSDDIQALRAPLTPAIPEGIVSFRVFS